MNIAPGRRHAEGVDARERPRVADWPAAGAQVSKAGALGAKSTNPCGHRWGVGQEKSLNGATSLLEMVGGGGCWPGIGLR